MVAFRLIIYSVNHSNIEFYKKHLSGFNCKIFIAYSYNHFISFIKEEPVDVIVIDLELDNNDAISVIKEIKQQKLSEALIVVCSAKADDFIQISALNSGADDFINVPVNPILFELKTKALIRRIKPEIKEKTLPFYVDRERYCIIIKNKPYFLPRLEFRLVDLLFSHPNKIFSKDEIATRIWNNKDISSRRTIDIHIRNIRKELGNEIIKTYRGLGYSLNLK